MTAVLDQLAKFERAKITERTRRGRLRKAREGKIVGTGTANYGFRYSDGTYEVVPEEMEIASEIFHKLADGKTIYEVATVLKKRGIKSPRGGLWHRSSIRPFALHDVYKAHSVEELVPYVSESVLSKLDPQKSYGIFWYNRHRKETKPISTIKNGEKVYQNQITLIEKPREEWVAIPVPDCGIPRSVVDKARENILENQWTASSNADRFWELSGGVAFCGDCGCRLTTVAVPNNRKLYLYYRCSNNWTGDCSNRKNYRAEDLEGKAISALQDLFSEQGNIKALIAEHFDKSIKELKKRNPDQEAKVYSQRIIKLNEKLSNAQDLAIDGLLSKADLNTKTTQIKDEIAVLERKLDSLSNANLRLEALERTKTTFMDLREFALAYDLGLIEDVGDDWLERGAAKRHEVYKALGMKMSVSKENITLEIEGNKLFSEVEHTTRWTSQSTSRRA